MPASYASTKTKKQRAAIRAVLTGSDTCSALDLTMQSASPVLDLCRALVRAGHDPATPLEACRGPIRCLRARSIGEAATLAVKPTGVGFERFRPGPQDRSSSPPIVPTAPARTRHRARRAA